MPEGICSVPGCERAAYCRGLCGAHYMKLRRTGSVDGHRWPTLEERLWARVDKNGPIPEYRPDLGPCWIWTGADNGHGYGTIGTGVGKNLAATHRVAYELVRGAVPDGLELDHLCRVRRCCNPTHLESVTRAVNMHRGEGWSGRNIRKTHCPQGHPYDEVNTYRPPRGGRGCRACLKANRTARTERDRARRVAARAESGEVRLR